MPALRQIGMFPVVLGLHLLVLWALQAGLAQDVMRAIQPTLFAQLLPAPTPPAPPAPPPPDPVIQPKPQPKPRLVAPPPPEPSERAITVEEPPLPVTAPSPPVLPAEPVAAAPAPPAPMTPPSFTAAYLNNPAPRYPDNSRRRGETGEVLLLVYVQADGDPGEMQLRRSSGHPALDEAALEAVRRWRFVAARQGDTEVGAWVLVPIRFSLK